MKKDVTHIQVEAEVRDALIQLKVKEEYASINKVIKELLKKCGGKL